MVFGQTSAAHRALPGRIGLLSTGSVIGTVSALMGVGGGSMSVPFLTWCNVPVRKAVATSAAIGFPIALSGALGYLVSGWNHAGLPPGSLGFINFPAFLGIAVASVLFAPLGAALAHRVAPQSLRRLFAVFLLVLSARMLLG